MLREATDKKFEALDEKNNAKQDSHTCYYSPKSRCKYCTHKQLCIFSDEFQEKDQKLSELNNKIKEEKQFLKNGVGCKDYDKIEIMVKIKKLEMEKDKYEM